jgi:hypothetical protein
MSKPSLSPELMATVQAALDDQLSSEQLAELEAELKVSPAAMRHYLMAAHMSSELRLLSLEKEALAGSLSAIQSIDDPEKNSSTTDPNTNPTSTPWLTLALRSISQPTPLSLILAGAFLSCVIVLLAVFTVPSWQRDRKSPKINQRETVARVMQLHNVTWAKGTMEWRDLMPINNGEALELQSGVVEIRFESGATALLEGPATLVAGNESLALLSSGRLLSKVPPRAAGFTVVTKAATFRDLGTEFGVFVGDDESAVAVVHEGSIEATVTGKKGGSRVLRAGESCKVTIDGKFDAPKNAPSFIHTLELGISRGLPLKGIRYKYVGENSKPEIAKHSGDGYRDDNRTELTDGLLGSNSYQDPLWTAWYQPAGHNTLPQPSIDFILPDGVTTHDANSLQIAYLVGHPAGVHAADRLEISISQDGKTYTKLQEFKGFDDVAAVEAESRFVSIELMDHAVAAKYVRLDFFNDAEWTFLSEVRFLSLGETRSEASHPDPTN